VTGLPPAADRSRPTLSPRARWSGPRAGQACFRLGWEHLQSRPPSGRQALLRYLLVSLATRCGWPAPTVASYDREKCPCQGAAVRAFPPRRGLRRRAKSPISLYGNGRYSIAPSKSPGARVRREWKRDRKKAGTVIRFIWADTSELSRLSGHAVTSAINKNGRRTQGRERGLTKSLAGGPLKLTSLLPHDRSCTDAPKAQRRANDRVSPAHSAASGRES